MCRFSLAEMEEVLDKAIRYYTKETELPFEQSHLMRLEAVKVTQQKEENSRLLKVCINEVYLSRKGHERITLEIRVNG